MILDEIPALIGNPIHENLLLGQSFEKLEEYTTATNTIIKEFLQTKNFYRGDELSEIRQNKLDAKITTLTDEQAEYIGVGKNGPFKKDTYRY